MTRTLFLLPALALLSACIPAQSRDAMSITPATTEQHFEQAAQARWEIVINSGHGLPGSPGADIVIQDYETVLQSIVDECELGATFLVQATDGISVLAILNDNLSPDQVACIRAKEQSGLRLSERVRTQ